MWEGILSVPIIVKVLGALSLILVINRFSKRLVVSVLVATLVLAFWSGHSAPRAAEIAWTRLSSASNLFLLLIVFQVIWLSSQMSLTGVMRDLVSVARARLSRRAAMAALPAVIGLLPMPGGALFSAPLVDSCDAEGDIAPGLKAQTNHWFRHVWEYWWPLYPGVLLALQLTGLQVWQFMLLGIPLSLCAIAAGYVFLLRRIDQEAQPAARGTAEAPAGFFSLVLPIIVVIACYTVVKLSYSGAKHIWPGIWEMNRYLPMAVGLFCAMLVLQVQRPIGRRQWREVIFSRRALNMAVIVAAVRVYGAFIDARLPNGELLGEQMRMEMEAVGIPLLAIVMILPLISGLATGLSVGFVGASFPIVLALLGQHPPTGSVIAITALAYGFGYMGMLLSPVHICLVVTSEHFETRVLHNVAGMLKPAAVVLAWSFLLHLLLRWVLV